MSLSHFIDSTHDSFSALPVYLFLTDIFYGRSLHYCVPQCFLVPEPRLSSSLNLNNIITINASQSGCLSLQAKANMKNSVLISGERRA